MGDKSPKQQKRNADQKKVAQNTKDVARAARTPAKAEPSTKSPKR